MVNERAIHFGIMIGLALECEIAERSLFHPQELLLSRPPEGLPDLPVQRALCLGGQLGDVRIHRVHLEEDATKLDRLRPSGRIHGSDRSWVDFNRGGTALEEIVTKPDIRSPEQAPSGLILLRTTLRQLGVSDVDISAGIVALRRQRLDPPTAPPTRDQPELKNNELVRVPRARRQGGGSSASNACSRRESRSSRRPPPLQPRHRQPHPAALPEEAQPLSLLPGARSCPARRRRGDVRRRAGGIPAELPADALSASTRRTRLHRHRPAIRVPSRARRLL